MSRHAQPDYVPGEVPQPKGKLEVKAQVVTPPPAGAKPTIIPQPAPEPPKKDLPGS